MFVYSLNNVNIKSSSPDSQSKPDLCDVAYINTLEADALTLQMGDVVETPTTTFIDGDSNTRGNTATTTIVDSEIHDQEVELMNFFQRPVEIYSGTWAIDGEVDVVFNPWNLWAINPRIANRLNNFKFFDGELCVKLVLNGNPFSWGCLMMSYLPNSNPNFVITTDPRNFQPSTFFADWMQASQRMHVLVDPTTSKGGELCLPLHPLYNGHTLTTSAFSNVGEIWLRSINTLRQLGTTKALTYTVYAWANKAKLSAPTQQNMAGLTAQAGLEETKGVLSQGLNVAADVAAAASQLPVVGKWATAAEVAARMGASVAQAFGYSKPILADNFVRNVPQDAYPFSVMDGLDTAVPLGSSFKQQVTVDPEASGFGGGDEMLVSKLASIPSLIYTSSWLPANTKNTLLCNFKVTPMLNFRGTRALINAQAVQLTPMGFAAANFAYWRGTMKVRVQIVANSFHRGRLLVTWDPNANNNSPQEQVLKSMIVDIAEQRDFSFDIGMCANQPMLATGYTQADIATFVANQTTQSNTESFTNGVCSIYVLNELISSVTSTTPIQVNVWVSMPDLQGFEPGFAAWANMGLYPTAPTVALVKEEEALEPQAGMMQSDILGNLAPDHYVLVPPVDKATPMGFNTGDTTESLRKIAKRYAFVRTENVTIVGTVANTYCAFRECVPTNPLQYGPGYTASGWDGSGTNTRKCIPLTPMAFIQQGYVFTRGGHRIAFKYKTGCANSDVTVSRARGQPTLTQLVTTDMVPDTYQSYRRAFDNSASGCVVANTGPNNVVAVEVPYCFGRKYSPATLATTALTNFEGSAIFVDYEIFNSSVTTRVIAYDSYIAAADDWHCLWFRGVPSVYVYTPP